MFFEPNELVLLLDTFRWVNFTILAALLFLLVSVFQGQARKFSRVMFTILSTVLIGWMLYVLIRTVWLSLIAGGFIASVVPLVFAILFSIALLIWYWKGPVRFRENIPLLVCILIGMYLFVTAPTVLCRSATDFKSAMAARCLSDHFRNGTGGVGVQYSKAVEYRQLAAEWGDNELAFMIYQHSKSQDARDWLNLAADNKNAVYKRYQLDRNHQDPIDVELLAELAEQQQIDAQYRYADWLVNNDQIEKGLALMLKAAENGSLNAQRALAHEYLGSGWLGVQDLEQSQKWFDESVANVEKIREHPDIGTLFYPYYLPEGYRARQVDSIFMLNYQEQKKSAKQRFGNESEALVKLGKKWFSHPSDTIKKRGMESLKKAAAKNSLEASKTLFFHFRSAAKKQPELLKDYFFHMEQSAKLGYSSAAKELATIYAEGRHGKSIDVAKAKEYATLALELSQKSSRRGDRFASDLLHTLDHSRRHAQERGYSVEELKMKVAQNDPQAMYMLSEAYHEPIYRNADTSRQSQELMRKSAELSYPPAQHRLYRNLLWSKKPEDKLLGWKWLNEAARKDYPPAVFALGRMHNSKRLFGAPSEHHSPYRAKFLMDRGLALAHANKDSLHLSKDGRLWMFHHRRGTSGTGQTLEGAQKSRDTAVPERLNRLDLSASTDAKKDITEWYYTELESAMNNADELANLNDLRDALIQDVEILDFLSEFD